MIHPPAPGPGAADHGANDPGLSEARALADPTRAAIHRHLVRAGGPVTIAELVALTGLHHTAVRQHLAKLEAAGLADHDALPPEGRGRPRLAYRGVEHAADRPYRLLAGMLADAVRTGRSAREVGHDAGIRSAPRGTDALVAVVAETRRMGFAPVLTEHDVGTGPGSGSAEIELHACPYAELALTDPGTVCSLPLGLAEGIADAVGGLAIDRLEPATAAGEPCRFRVRRV